MKKNLIVSRPGVNYLEHPPSQPDLIIEAGSESPSLCHGDLLLLTHLDIPSLAQVNMQDGEERGDEFIDVRKLDYKLGLVDEYYMFLDVLQHINKERVDRVISSTPPLGHRGPTTPSSPFTMER